MSVIHTALSDIGTAEAQCFQSLEITPLLAPLAGKADYLTLTEAQRLGLAVVTEVSESGSVPTLLLENAADAAVFLLDGEELVGAKQNRILNLSVLVPPRSKLEIPVSCVEQGRWSHRSREFAATGRAHFSRGRARKAARVSENLRESGYRDSNQSEVWSDIGIKMRRMSVDSDTGAIADAYEHFSGSVDEYVDAFCTTETQIGACFAINGEIRGLELFDASDTCGKLMPKLIRSYALDALEERQAGEMTTTQDVQGFLQAIASAPTDSFDALGEGEDLRIHANTIAGGALAARNRVIHLCAFRQEFEAGTLDSSGHVPRASARQRYRARPAQLRTFLDDIDDDQLS